MSFERKFEDSKHVNDNKKQKKLDVSFETGNHQNFDLKFPFFRKPQEIGAFSLDIKREFENSDKQLRYFVKPDNFYRVNFDLRKGYSSMVRKDESKKEYINDILHWILKNKEKFAILEGGTHENLNDVNSGAQKNSPLNTDFVCWRGLLTKFLCTPYENREGWLVAVTLHKGTYYICEFDTDQKIQQNTSRSNRDDEMCCWGWKFEQYLTADSASSIPDTESPYNNCEAFCTVVRSRLNTHSLVFSGEVDAVHTDKKYGRHYIELKTSREFSHPRQQTSFKRYKLIKWWAQSFLVGIPEIVCGFRDDDGIVHRLQSFDTQNIPNFSQDIPNPWKPNVCFNFMDQLLTFIKNMIKTDDHRTVQLVQWSPGEAVTCSKPMKDSEYNFLPDWYTGT